MTVTSVKELAQKSGGVDREGTYRATRVFQVQSNDPAEEVAAVLLAVGVFPNSFHPDPQMPATCEDVVANQTDNRTTWVVEARYESGTPPDEKDPDNPLNDRPQISWSSSAYQHRIDEDINGNPIVNTAGKPYDQPVEVEFADWVVSYSVNLAVVPAFLLQYENAVNSDPFTVDGVAILPQQGQIRGLRISPVMIRNDIAYRQVSLEIYIRTDLWTELKFEEGDEEYVDTSDHSKGWKRISLPGPPKFDPPGLWPLDKDGAAIQNPTTQNMLSTEWQARKELQFSPLGFA